MPRRLTKHSLLDPRSWEAAQGPPPNLFDEPEELDGPLPRVCRGCGQSIAHRRITALFCEDECRRLFTTYGLGILQWRALYEAQGGVCAICRRRQKMQALAVDHDHKTQLVRGLLCLKCNRELLGAGRHSAALFRSAAEYLDTPPAVAVIGEVKAPK